MLWALKSNYGVGDHPKSMYAAVKVFLENVHKCQCSPPEKAKAAAMMRVAIDPWIGSRQCPQVEGSIWSYCF